jgi:hypothetical protein
LVSKPLSTALSPWQVQAFSGLGLLPVIAVLLRASKPRAGMNSRRGFWLAFGAGLLSSLGNVAYYQALATGGNPDTLATEVVHAAQPGGNFLAEEHMVKHLRRELWIPGAAWTRQAFGVWESDGAKSMAERLRSEMQRLLKSQQPPPVAPEFAQALDDIVARAKASFG